MPTARRVPVPPEVRHPAYRPLMNYLYTFCASCSYLQPQRLPPPRSMTRVEATVRRDGAAQLPGVQGGRARQLSLRREARGARADARQGARRVMRQQYSHVTDVQTVQCTVYIVKHCTQRKIRR